MIFRDLSFIPWILLAICSSIVLVQITWRRMMIVLGLQYLAAFWLVALNWPLGLALVKLIVGIVVCVVLSASSGAAQEFDFVAKPLSLRRIYISSAQLFRAFAAIFGVILALSFALGAQAWLPVAPDVVRGGLVLVILGLLQLGMTTKPGHSVVGLLTVISGFEILYAGLESSVLVAGLLAALNLGLALVASYAIAVSPSSAEDGEEVGP